MRSATERMSTRGCEIRLAKIRTRPGSTAPTTASASPYMAKARQLRQLATKLKNSDLPALTPFQPVKSGANQNAMSRGEAITMMMPRSVSRAWASSGLMPSLMSIGSPKAKPASTSRLEPTRCRTPRRIRPARWASRPNIRDSPVNARPPSMARQPLASITVSAGSSSGSRMGPIVGITFTRLTVSR